MAALPRKRQSQMDDEKLAIVEHFDFVQNRIEDLIRHTKGLVSLLKKRVQVEKDHLKAMQKLAQGVHEDSQLRQVKFEGELCSQWSAVSDGLLSEALFVSNISSTLESQALQPLTVHLLNDLDKRFRSAIAEGRKLIRDYHNAKVAVQKARDKYYSATAEWEAILIALYAEGGSNWNPTPGHKLYEREQLTAKKSEEMKAEYELAAKKASDLQTELHKTQMPEVLLLLNNIALNMVTIVHNALKKFEYCQSQVLGPEHRKSPTPNGEFNMSEYTYRVLFGGDSVDSFPDPHPIEIQEYTFKDEAVMVSTRKVQYKAMSHLSPEELVSRGAMFLNEMSKDNHHHQPQHVKDPALLSPSPPPSGLNSELISLCVEYLHQPVALREEGLFRVPGDNSLMKTMHKDFQSGLASNEYLRMTVMDQRDPNTVAGLLKLHLRENSLLSEESLGMLLPHLEAKNTEKLLEAVPHDLSSTELHHLVQIVGLLAEVCKEPWMTTNRMTPRTLGMACGLSLFPPLKPEMAILLVETLVRNIERIRETQSIL